MGNKYSSSLTPWGSVTLGACSLQPALQWDEAPIAHRGNLPDATACRGCLPSRVISPLPLLVFPFFPNTFPALESLSQNLLLGRPKRRHSKMQGTNLGPERVLGSRNKVTRFPLTPFPPAGMNRSCMSTPVIQQENHQIMLVPQRDKQSNDLQRSEGVVKPHQVVRGGFSKVISGLEDEEEPARGSSGRGFSWQRAQQVGGWGWHGNGTGKAGMSEEQKGVSVPHTRHQTRG